MATILEGLWRGAQKTHSSNTQFLNFIRACDGRHYWQAPPLTGNRPSAGIVHCLCFHICSFLFRFLQSAKLGNDCKDRRIWRSGPFSYGLFISTFPAEPFQHGGRVGHPISQWNKHSWKNLARHYLSLVDKCRRFTVRKFSFESCFFL